MPLIPPISENAQAQAAYQALRGRAWRIVWLVLIVGVVAATAWRSVRNYDDPAVSAMDRDHQGQFDFHNGVYFPARAFLSGVSPYGSRFAEQYPVTRPLPLMSPGVLLIHSPLGLLPVTAAEIAYYAINVILLVWLGWMCVNWIEDTDQRLNWWLVSCLLIFASRSGHTTLLTGYMTALLVIGTVVALSQARTRPWLAACGVLLASCKPTYAIPLFLLLVARGDQRAAWRGLALSVMAAGLAVGRLLLSTTPQQFLTDLRLGQAAHMADAAELPINTWTRIDLLALIAKWFAWAPSELMHLCVMVCLLPLPALALWRLRRVDDEDCSAAGLSSGVIAVSMLATLYHHVYDALLLFPIIVGLLLEAPSTQRGRRSIRLMMGMLLLFVTWNYASSDFVLRRLDLSGLQQRWVTSASAIALATSWLGVCLLAWLPRASGLPAKKGHTLQESGLLTNDC